MIVLGAGKGNSMGCQQSAHLYYRTESALSCSYSSFLLSRVRQYLPALPGAKTLGECSKHRSMSAKPCNIAHILPRAEPRAVRWSAPRRFAGFLIPPYPLHSLNSDAPSLNQRRGVNLRIDTSEEMLQEARDALESTYMSIDWASLALQATPVDEDGNPLPVQQPSAAGDAQEHQPHTQAETGHIPQYSLVVDVVPEEPPLADLERDYKRMPLEEPAPSPAARAAQRTNEDEVTDGAGATQTADEPATPRCCSHSPEDSPAPASPTTPAQTVPHPRLPRRTDDRDSDHDGDADEDDVSDVPSAWSPPPPPYQMHVCDFRVLP